MQALTQEQITCVSGAGWDDFSLLGGGFYNSSNNYGMTMGGAYTFDFGGSSFTPYVGGFNFSSYSSTPQQPTIGFTYSW